METKRKTNIAFILKEAGSQKYKMYLSVFFSVVSGLCKIFPYILLQVIIVELLSASPDKEKIQLYIFICFGTVGINILFLALGLAFSHCRFFYFI
jgi:ATP-binding cassette subfamily B protein